MIYLKFCIVFFAWSIWLKAVFELFFSANSLNKFLMVSAFLAPFYSISFPLFGFQFSIYKLIIPLVLLHTLLFYKTIHKNILIISTYFFVVSLFSYMFAFYNNYFDFVIDYGREPLYAYVMPIVQGFFLILTVCAPWILIKKNTFVDIFRVFSYYIYGCVSLVLLGWIQILFYKLNIPWFDFWFLFDAFGRFIEDEKTGEALGLASRAFDSGHYRMSSLGGEPRHFGAFVVLSIIFFLWLKKNSPNRIPFIHGNLGYLILFLLISGAYASMSSSALLSLIIGILVYYTLQSRVVLFLSSFLILILLLVLLFNFSGYTKMVSYEYGDTIMGVDQYGPFDFLYTLLWKLSSIDTMLYAAPKDAFAVRAFFNDFWHFLIGYGVSMADLYVPEFWLKYDTPFGEVNDYNSPTALQQSVTPTSGILQIILSGGLVGAGLLFYLLFKTCISLDKSILVLVVTILSMVTVSSSLMFTLGLVFISLLIYHGKSQKFPIIKS